MMRIKETNTKIKRYIYFLTVAIVLLSLVLTGCNSEEYYHPAEDDDVAVMGSADENKNNNDKENYSKRVAITYDDGPHNVRTKKIVDELEKYGYSATFFVLGNRVDGTEYNGADALKYAYQKGNEIAIHGYTHKVYYNKCTDAEFNDEMSKTEKAIKDAIGAPIHLMRPIGGAITDERVQTCKYSVVKWDVDSEDWKYKYSDGSEDGAEEKLNTIVDNVMSSVRDGSIILMHDIYESTYEATVIILERLHSEGYEVVSVSELLGADRSAGKLYSSGR